MKVTVVGKITIFILVLGLAVGIGRRFWNPSQLPSLVPGISSEENRGAVQAKGLVGGEKSGFLADPQVLSILKTKFDITVSVDRVGSLEMVRGSTQGLDFLWPSSQVALDIYKNRKAPLQKATVIFNSPLVLYSWADTTNALIKQGIVRRKDGSYFVVNMPKLVGLMNSNKRWKDIGLNDFFGPIVIHSTDPTKSNSGMMFAGLLATMLNKGEVVDERSVGKTLPTLGRFFQRLGYMQHGSGDIFDQFLQMGEGAYPLMVGYENQLIEFGIQHESQRDLLNRQVRVLYPQPTVWSAHPLIALNDTGERLLEALRDPQIQQLAWERHGFRSGSMIVTKPLPGVPEKVQSVVPMPSAAVMARITSSLNVK